MKCKKCKKELPDESIFCMYCGAAQTQKKKKMYQRPDGLFEKTIVVDGKRKTFRAKSEREVLQKIASHEANKIAGPLFSEVAKSYQEKAVDPAKAGTKKAYAPALAEIVSEFGECYISQIQPHQIAAYFERLKAQGVAYKTASNRKTVLNGVFKTWIASEEWQGTHNPAALIGIPRGMEQKERTPPTAEQVQAVRDEIEKESTAKNVSIGAIMAAVYMYTGCRRGEGLALQWGDIDFDTQIITVSKSVEHLGNAPHITDTKTKNGVRSIPLVSALHDILLPLRQGNNCYVIGGKQEPITQSALKRNWISFCRQAGLTYTVTREIKKNRRGRVDTVQASEHKPVVTPHQFRHEFCTILIMQGVPEETAVHIMGHADTKMIHERYFHFKRKMLGEASVKLDEYFCTENTQNH